tara:strand:- start:693 stop:1058 length:366 start_codon:yes stop_codon:yes gene_type:complete
MEHRRSSILQLPSLPHIYSYFGIIANTSGLNSGTLKGGGCWGDGTRFCGVFLQGTNCAMSGNAMWENYQNIRKLGGCSKCGSFHLDNGCLLTVNYVSHCDDTPQQGGGGLRMASNATTWVA